jgi:predicted acylesterase/phospholipase RssA
LRGSIREIEMSVSAAARPAEAAGSPKRIAPAAVRYLALEGGGGKGFAYLGALGVLEELGVMDHLDGFAGASAGAITALLLSLGYDREKLERYLDEEMDFNAFFDTPVRRSRPIVRGCRLVDDTQEETELIERLKVLPTGAAIAEFVLAAGAGGLLGQMVLLYLQAKRDEVMKAIGDRKDKPPLSLLLQHWPKYVAYMGRDMGLFDGCGARDEFERLLSENVPSGRASRLKNVTFAQHHQIMETTLLVTGSNLTTGRTQLFSHEETPHFPVADAIRISMSMPFIYKPYVITESRPGWPPCGTYVDGGLWNNLPFRDFDAGPVPKPPANGSPARRAEVGTQPRTLGLRLEITPSRAVRDFGDLLGKTASFGLFGTGETQILSKHVDQMILLDTRGLDLVDFKPPKAKRDAAIKRARRATWRYFGLPVPEADLDPTDDAATAAIFAEDRPCG